MRRKSYKTHSKYQNMSNTNIRIFSFNANNKLSKNCAQNQEDMLNVLEKEKYDIIALQECPNDFTGKLRETYNVRNYNGNVIALNNKFKILQSDIHCNHVSCRVSHMGLIINIICLHLPSGQGKNKQQRVDLIKLRYNMLESLISNPSGENIILAGDINMRQEEFNNFITNHREIKCSRKLATFGDSSYDKIMLLSDDMNFVDNTTFTKDIGICSDHKAVISVISMKKNDYCNKTHTCKIDFIKNIPCKSGINEDIAVLYFSNLIENVVKSPTGKIAIGACIIAGLLYYNRK